ncbi:MAG: type II toxin-antitoxin system VapC family toxin [Proteobacteria bacterium]|nr:type II toxin-antitoxin system VapC family toxin [Pseudomonadota bacterium]
MASVFVDTSALVKYYYPENGSERVESIILETERIYLCRLATTEFASALIKKMRVGTLTVESQVLIWNTFLDDLHTGQMELIPLDERHYFKAAEIIRGYGAEEGIRTLDSLQLIAALDVHDSVFISADKFLSSFAVKIGLKVEPI